MLDCWYKTTLWEKTPEKAKKMLRDILENTVAKSVVDSVLGKVPSPAERELNVNLDPDAIDTIESEETSL